jgi:HEAT repeat protein
MPLLLASALGERAAPRLIEALGDAEVDVAINAATQLGQLRSLSAFEPLRDLLNDRNAPLALRGAAAAALGATRDTRALAILAPLTTTSETELLAGAIDGLADLRDPLGAPYLEAILDRQDIAETTTRAVRLGLLAMERYRKD